LDRWDEPKSEKNRGRAFETQLFAMQLLFLSYVGRQIAHFASQLSIFVDTYYSHGAIDARGVSSRRPPTQLFAAAGRHAQFNGATTKNRIKKRLIYAQRQNWPRFVARSLN